MKRIILSAAIAAVTLISSQAKVVRNYASQSDNTLTFQVDSVDYRPDLTRVYGKLIGRPHTSGRIDNIQLLGTGTVSGATDIDGVDFKRYFQWEDDGMIPIEIDFPALKTLKEAKLLFDTAHGQSTTVMTVSAAKKRK